MNKLKFRSQNFQKVTLSPNESGVLKSEMQDTSPEKYKQSTFSNSRKNANRNENEVCLFNISRISCDLF